MRLRPDRTRTFWLAGSYYLVAAVAVTMWLWRDPASRIVAANPYDSDQFAWFFRYDATAVAHLRLPALSTAAMNAPQGVNLMWNTPMLLPGVLLAPLTLLAGPQASITVLLTLGFAGSALALFAVLRRWDASTPAAAAGGLVYGFSPALVQSAQGHYDLQFAVLPPLIVDAVLQLATGRCGTGQRPAAACGAWLGLLMAAQIFISEELLFDAGIAAAIAVTVLAVGRLRDVLVLGRPRDVLGRQRDVLGRARDVLYGGATAVAVAALIAGYALREQFLGPIRQRGSPFTPDFYKNDLAGFVQPSAAMLVHTRASAAFAAAFQGGSPEYLAYLGWPMLIALAAAAVLFWRRPPVRVTAMVFVVLEVLSLGGTLLADGHGHAWIKLPWYWLQTLPVTGSAIPDRFSILADGAAAALLAFGLDAALARWAGARLPESRWGMRWHRAHGESGGRRSHWRCWPPSCRLCRARCRPVPAPACRPGGRRRSRRCGFRPARTFSCCPFRCRRSPSRCGGRRTPGNRRQWSAATSWARPAAARQKPMAAGCPQRARTLTGCGRSHRRATLRRASPPDRPCDPGWHADAGAVRGLEAAAVVAVTADHSALGRYLTSLLGPPTISAGGILGWRLPPAD